MGHTERGGAALRLAVALAVLAAGYVGLAVFLGRHVPANASVAGIPIGGKSPADAEATLKRHLAARASAPVTLAFPGRTVEIDPSAAGLSLDLPETLQGLSGFSLKPADLWNHLDGGQDEPLRTDVDRDRLRAVLTETAKSIDKTPREGSITFPDGRVRLVAPVNGTTVQVDETTEAVARSWPAEEPVRAVVEAVQPRVSPEELKRANAEFAAPAMSGPLRGRRVDDPRAQAGRLRAGHHHARRRGGPRRPGLRQQEAAGGRAQGCREQGRRGQATRRPVHVPGRQGRGRSLGRRREHRREVARVGLRARAHLTEPDRHGEDRGRAAGADDGGGQEGRSREVISTFTTYFPDNPPRTNNIKIAARTLNGTFIAPGKQFSLNGVLGQRTAAKGYSEAPVIMNGRLVSDYGGGVSQVSTTTFNAAFFSGVRIDEYLPHSFYISRYPEGREATVSWPNVDQKWTNDTGTGILIQAYTSGNALTVTFHGAKVWDIEAVKGPRRNIVKPKNIVDKSKTCVPQTPSEGFDVSVTRIFKMNGAEVKRSQFSTHYIPEDKVTCTHPDAK